MGFIIDSIKDIVPEALTGLVSGGVAWVFARRKRQAENDASELDNVEKATAIWRQLAEDLKKEVQDLRAGQEELHNENQELKKLVSSLKRELEETREQFQKK